MDWYKDIFKLIFSFLVSLFSWVDIYYSGMMEQ